MADPPIIQLPAAGADAVSAAHQTAVAAPALASSASLLQLVQHDAGRDVWQVSSSSSLLQAAPGSLHQKPICMFTASPALAVFGLLPTVLTQCMAAQALWAQQVTTVDHTWAG